MPLKLPTVPPLSPYQDFHYPLFMTLVHIIFIFWLSTLTRSILQWWTGKPRVVLSWKDYLTKVAPTGAYHFTHKNAGEVLGASGRVATLLAKFDTKKTVCVCVCVVGWRVAKD